MAFPFAIEHCYPRSPTCWLGRRIAIPKEFDFFLTSEVRARVSDAEFESDFEQDLQALATTQMSSQALAAVLNAKPPLLDWEIGEAIAECLLGHEFNIVWPWNENRDRKTPRASLPGPDIVGIAEEGGTPILLFGEVKTSSENKQPPGVMSGRHGLKHQIDNLIEQQSLQTVLLKWLYARCKNTPHWPKFQAACESYLASNGKNVTLVGVLLRDTPPHQDDLRTRGKKFADRKEPQPKVRLHAWYTPRAISDWVSIVEGNTQ